MKITAAQPLTALLIETDETEGSGMYRRYGPDNWEKSYGESWEMVYDCAELEAAFRAYARESK